jgi:flagellar hook-associated protein FlgK
MKKKKNTFSVTEIEALLSAVYTQIETINALEKHKSAEIKEEIKLLNRLVKKLSSLQCKIV